MKIKVFQGTIPATDHCQHHETTTKCTKNTISKTWMTKPRRVTEDHLYVTTELGEDDAESKNDDGEEVYKTTDDSRRSRFNVVEEERTSLIRETITAKPCLYVYDQLNEINGGRHTGSRHRRRSGILAACSLDDYDQNKIRRHENTMDSKLTSLLADSYHHPTPPICLTFRDNPKIQALIDATLANNTLSVLPVFYSASVDGISHTTRLWQVVDEDIISSMVREFARIPVAYIADGHHRIASASRIRMERVFNNPQHDGTEDYNWLLGVLFPASHMDILPYNRIMKNLNGQTGEELVTRISAKFQVTPTDSPSPMAPGNVHMYLKGKWYCIILDCYFPSSSTRTSMKLNVSHGSCPDVVILQDEILNPLLNVDDPRTNECLVVVDGNHPLGVNELEARVNSGEMAVAFSMYPITVDQMMDFVDANGIMPPKSTWFEPKIRPELVVQQWWGIRA